MVFIQSNYCLLIREIKLFTFIVIADTFGTLSFVLFYFYCFSKIPMPYFELFTFNLKYF